MFKTLTQWWTVLFTIAGFNVTGVMITKYASAAQRSTVDTSRTLIIWIVFIFAGSEHFLWGEMFGFVLLVIGTLVYNEIIEIPIKFMNYNTKANISKREQLKAEKDDKKDIESINVESSDTKSIKSKSL